MVLHFWGGDALNTHLCHFCCVSLLERQLNSSDYWCDVDFTIDGANCGAGQGVVVYDFDLVKRASLNLGIATLISLIVSALYFSISPLQDAQSELLARTTPTVWDVVNALFGGVAGIVGAT